MTRRGLAVSAALITSGLCALSLGSPLYTYIALLLIIVLLYSFVSCLWARATLECEQSLSSPTISRGNPPGSFCAPAIAALCRCLPWRGRIA